MTSETRVRSRLLPVWILAGPSARALLRDVATLNPECRFVVLTDRSRDFTSDLAQFIPNDKLISEQLPLTQHESYDWGQIKQRIATFAPTALAQHLIIECDSRTHPIAFVSLFLPDSHGLQQLSEVARLNSILVAIESEDLVNSLIQGMKIRDIFSPCILADQVECADVVVLDGDPASKGFRLARAVVSALNPRAEITDGGRASARWKLPALPASLDFETTFAGAGWRELMNGEPRLQHGDQGVISFIYRARRPFHPERFWNLSHRPFPGVFRAKGFFWLATRMESVGGLTIAGSECHFSRAGAWWAAHNHGHDADGREIPERIRNEWVEPFGDRRQAIAFMGVDVDPVAVTAQLDACLLDSSEMSLGEQDWSTLPDPFPDWSATGPHHDCDDDDCCCH